MSITARKYLWACVGWDVKPYSRTSSLAYTGVEGPSQTTCPSLNPVLHNTL